MADSQNDSQKLPGHIAIVMDGNGRWAKKRLMARSFGHRAGANNLKKLTEKMNSAGYKNLTVYAFSTENWKRDESEVSALMNLFREFIRQYADDAERNTLRVSVIGDTNALDADLKEDIARLAEITKNHSGLHVSLAINYGSRDEIRRAVTNIANDVLLRKVYPEKITEELIGSYLDTAELPPPDLLIRTGGEARLSNFLLWQLSYAELYFTDTLWPDFTFEDLETAVSWYNARSRRFGG